MKALFLDIIVSPMERFMWNYGWTIPVVLVIIAAVVVAAIIVRRRKKK